MALITYGPVNSDVWVGTTQYNLGQIRMYAGSGTTDANGRATFNLTTTGLSGGAALFTSVANITAISFDGSGNPLQAPLCFVESASATQIIIRCVRGVSQGILIGGTINTLQYVGAGYTVQLSAMGLKAF